MSWIHDPPFFVMAVEGRMQLFCPLFEKGQVGSLQFLAESKGKSASGASPAPSTSDQAANVFPAPPDKTRFGNQYFNVEGAPVQLHCSTAALQSFVP